MLRIAGWVSLVLTMMLALTGFVPAHAEAPKVVIDKARYGDKCVEPTEYMRRNHMKLLLHERNLTVHEGIRTKRYSLKECINCHASKETNSVTAAKDNFCVSCHAFAAVKIDCFECHSSKPQGSAMMHPLTAAGAHLKHQLAAQANVAVSVNDMAGIAK
jgi:predicted CXXCH cytochrome family protein